MNTGMARSCALAVALCLGACTAGPDYRRPAVEIPMSFKEGAAWQRSEANPQGALASTWWREYRDPVLTRLVEDALAANQSIVAAEAAHRLALASVDASRAALFPTVTAGMAVSRAESPASSPSPGVRKAASATLAAGWEPDLWGQVRRGIESSRDNAQATDAQLAGVRLSIAAGVAADYFALRQLDMDIDLLQRERDIDARLLEMTRASLQQGIASNDNLLIAQDALETAVALLEASKRAREQLEHAVAVLVGLPPALFSISARPDYAFTLPEVPLTVPSELLERRPDVVAAERIAASANARIGVAKAAFFPSLTLSGEGGFAGSTLAGLFSLPNRLWALGPALAATLFDGGARDAAVRQAQASYDQDVAEYRGTVLTALQNVEDSLSACNHLREQARAFEEIYGRTRQLFESQRAQLAAGTASEQNVLTEQLTLLAAEQNLKDSQALLLQASVGLVMNLGGGWRWDEAPKAP